MKLSFVGVGLVDLKAAVEIDIVILTLCKKTSSQGPDNACCLIVEGKKLEFLGYCLSSQFQWRKESVRSYPTSTCGSLDDLPLFNRTRDQQLRYEQVHVILYMR